ncbi:MAG TPA: penicillin-binding protein 1A, partial [Alphaproteobacteria bacterium]|nr:penicillin-binding protein 1A [Alphaproteobacteria bacterium]
MLTLSRIDMRFIGWLFSSFVVLLLAGGIGGLLALKYFSRDLPDYTQLADYEPPVTTRLHAGDGRLLAEYATENRLFVPIEAIPEHVIQAFVSAEDQHFYSHSGVDFRGIARAVVTNIRNVLEGRRMIGASTITQQVAKNFLLTNEYSFERKIREALIAFRIEQAFTKDQILELYLNQIYLGRGSYGVAAAALNYFNKPLADLTLAEAAYLAALPKAPNNYHPVYQYDAAVARRNYVISRMLDDGAIRPEQARAAENEPLEAVSPDATELVRADYFAEEVRRELKQVYGDAALYQGGLSVRTSVDPRLQQIAVRALRNGLVAYDRRHGWRGPLATLDDFDAWPEQLAAIEQPIDAGDWEMAVVLEVDADKAVIGFVDRSRGVLPMEELTWAAPWREDQRVGPTPDRADDVLALGDVVLVESLADDAEVTVVTAAGEVPLRRYGLRQIPAVEGALIAMDPHTGRVLAMVGGYSFEESEFNRATQAVRQPGSAFKPFVYLTALEEGYTPSTILLDSPLAIDQGPGLGMWRPTNYEEGSFLGPVPLRVGVEKSRNLMTVRLLQEIGLEPVRDTAKRFGVYEEMPLLYSMALGAGETTPIKLTAAYAMMVNGGKKIEPTFIDRVQDRTGETVYRHDRRDCAECQDVEWTGQQAPLLPDDREQVTDPVTAYQMVSILEGVVQRGTAVRLRGLGVTLAGKTGTTNESFDTWFVGFSPDLVAGVFVGFDTPRTLGARETGSSAALPIFGAFMADALTGKEVLPFRIPPGVSLVRINPSTGLLARPGEPAIWGAYRP